MEKCRTIIKLRDKKSGSIELILNDLKEYELGDICEVKEYKYFISPSLFPFGDYSEINPEIYGFTVPAGRYKVTVKKELNQKLTHFVDGYRGKSIYYLMDKIK